MRWRSKSSKECLLRIHAAISFRSKIILSLNTFILPGTSWSRDPWTEHEGWITGAAQMRFFFLVGGERWSESLGKGGGDSGLHVSSDQRGDQSRVQLKTMWLLDVHPRQKEGKS